MADNLAFTATDIESDTPHLDPVTPQDLAEMIEEFERYRQRLIDEMTTAAQKAKLSKSKLMSKLEPELARIDATLDNLRAQHATLTA
jgi:prefoldin subunit 5